MIKGCMNMDSEPVPIIPVVGAVLTAQYTSSRVLESSDDCVAAILVGGFCGASAGILIAVAIEG